MVKHISKAILNDGWKEQSQWRFCPNGKESTGTARKAQEFLRLLKNYIERHLQLREGKDREAHYEDLHAAAQQIVQDELCELVNPMLQGSVAELRKQAENLYAGEVPHINNDPFVSLAQRARDLIHWAVVHKLAKAKKPIGMEAITAVANATTRLDIFSLNHDLLIERQFEQAEIPIADGFAHKNGDVRRFDWSWDASKVRLYKLHGSIDWYRIEFSDKEVQFAKVVGDSDQLIGNAEHLVRCADHCKDSTAKDLRLAHPFPLILAGSTDKERRYGIGFPGELFFEFHKQLRAHHTLICCGYGWSDQGINNRLAQWVARKRGNKLVVLHKSQDKLMQKKFWKDNWKIFRPSNMVEIVPKWLEDCEIKDLSRFFE